MIYYIIIIAVYAVIVLAVSEIAKRHPGFAALVASLPLTSLLAFVWLHLESTPSVRIADLSMQIFWLVIPSLVLFIVFSFMVRQGMNFWASGAPALDVLTRTLVEQAPKHHAENIAACEEGYRWIATQSLGTDA